MTSPTNFEGEVIVGVGAYSIPVTATNFNNLGSATNVVRTFTANGLDTRLSYDQAGNLLAKANSDGSLSFGWDGADRCTAITNGTSRTALAYDGIGRWSRIQEYSGASLTADRRFVWNGTSPAEERDSTGTTVVKRFYANGFWQQGTNYYYLTDHLGSIRKVTLANGTVVARFEYDPYGRRTQTFGTLWVDFGFAGLFELPNGLKLAVWRVYDPNTGRWNSRDPIKEDGGWNVYAYCGGNAVNAIDPSGTNPLIPDFVISDWKRFIAYVRGSTSPAAGYLVRHYMQGTGTPVVLKANGMAAMSVKIDLGRSLKPLLDQSQTLNITLTDYRFPLHANEGGTLGSFTGHVSGHLCQSDGKWIFSGEVSFSDKYDFDVQWFRTWKAPFQTHRDVGGEVMTIIGALLIPGTEFPISSVPTTINQQSGEAEAHWIGEGSLPLFQPK